MLAVKIELHEDTVLVIIFMQCTGTYCYGETDILREIPTYLFLNGKSTSQSHVWMVFMWCVGHSTVGACEKNVKSVKNPCSRTTIIATTEMLINVTDSSFWYGAYCRNDG